MTDVFARADRQLSARLILSASAVFAVSILSLAAGTSLLVVMCAAVILACLGALLPRVKSLPEALAALFVTQNFGLAIAARVITLRDLDGSLAHPAASYACAAFLSLALTLAAIYLPRTQRWELPKFTSVLVAEWVAVVSLLWSLTAITATLLLAGVYVGTQASVSGSGIFSKHIVFICVPVIIYMIDPRFRRSAVIKIAALSSVTVAIVLMMLLNQRKIGFDVAAAAIIARIASGKRLSPVPIVGAVLASALLFTYVSPIISYMRFDISKIDIRERPTFILANLPRYHQDVVSGRPLPENVALGLSARYLNYAVSGAVGQRLNGVQILDFAFSTQRVGFTADDPLLFGLRQSLPSILSTNKKRHGLGDLFTWHAGLRPVGAVGYPFVNSPAASVWGYGPVLGIALSAAFLIAILAAAGTMSNRFGGSVFGILLFIGLYNPVAEGDIAKHIEVLVRYIPEIAVTCLLIARAGLSLAQFADVHGRREKSLYRPSQATKLRQDYPNVAPRE